MDDRGTWVTISSPNPIEETWPLAGKYHQGGGHIAVLLRNGTILIAGGNRYEAIDSVEPLGRLTQIYAPDLDAWRRVGDLNEPRYGSGLVLPDGRVLISGGIGVDLSDVRPKHSTELFDPVTETWSYTGAMNVGRTAHTLTLLGDGRVLATGGQGDEAFEEHGVLTTWSAEIWDPRTGIWSIIEPMLFARVGHTATSLADGSVLVVGGAFTKNAEIYDPVNGVWVLAGLQQKSRMNHTSTLLSDGTVLVVGGSEYSEHGGWFDTASAELYISNPN